jgi:hypothetical protein
MVFGLRYRHPKGSKKPIRGDTIDKALKAVGQGIANLGGRDPRKETDGSLRNDPVLAAFLKRLRDEDDPATRAHPANLTILRGLLDALDIGDDEYGALNAHIIDLIIVAFYWLLRPAEYLDSASDEDSRSQAFLYRDISLTLDGTTTDGPSTPLNDELVQRITNATLRFSDQKNAVRGEQVGHRANTDPFFCPAKALGRIALRLRRDGARPDTPICSHYNHHSKHQAWHTVKPQYITNALRYSAAALEPTTGIPPHLLSARSLRPGGATALLCAGIDSDHIQLLGRWQSDAMFRYLRIQAATGALSQKMLDHGDYSFAPGAYALPGAIPTQAPVSIRDLLAHEELAE